ncbi:GntR family transcriptional regulator [Paraglaciecola sp. Hal342]|jgi:DNA-binding GntR family transcriptional regulator
MHNRKTHTLYQQLKQDIVQGKLPEKQALKQAQLAERYGVSRIPIRDALQRLKNEGWLVEHGKSSVMLRPLNADDAQDLYLMRMHLEPMLLAHAAPNINFETLGKARDILLQLKAISPEDILLNGELNWQFHRCLYVPANRAALFDTVAHLHLLCARYIGFHETELAYFDRSQDEHDALLNALSANQHEKAGAILSQHIQVAGEQLVKYLIQRY